MVLRKRRNCNCFLLLTPTASTSKIVFLNAEAVKWYSQTTELHAVIAGANSSEIYQFLTTLHKCYRTCEAEPLNSVYFSTDTHDLNNFWESGGPEV